MTTKPETTNLDDIKWEVKNPTGCTKMLTSFLLWILAIVAILYAIIFLVLKIGEMIGY